MSEDKLILEIFMGFKATFKSNSELKNPSNIDYVYRVLTSSFHLYQL